ncbi:MAG: alpha/beta fold hydrolase [Vicinamibacterales bacterium]
MSLGRPLLRGLAALVFAALAGATYQGVATALERRRLPHPGRLVSVGTHQLHITCVGDGSPTVVLEAPVGGVSSEWTLVQDLLQPSVRSCAYDRAGLGWSEAGDVPFDPSGVSADLHALLRRAEEPGPYVVAGHGSGAWFATAFARAYPDDTAALVLIDPATSATGPPDWSPMGGSPMAPWLARIGLLRIGGWIAAAPTDLPPAADGALRAFSQRPDHLTRVAQEQRAMASGSLMPPSPRDTVTVTTRATLTGIRASPLHDRATSSQVATALRSVVNTWRAAHESSSYVPATAER